MSTINKSIEIHQVWLYYFLQEKTTLKDCFYISVTYHILMVILFLGIISDIICFKL